MITHLSRSILALMILAIATLSFAEVGYSMFFYQLNGYPKTNQNCHVEAKAIADRFSKMTGIAATGECKAIRELSYDISVAYNSPKEISKVTTYPDPLFTDRIHIFSNEETCKDRLRTELDYFKIRTELEPLIALCSVDETYSGIKTWAIRIDAFGSSRLQPYWADSFMIGKVDGKSEEEAEAMIATSFLNAGVDVRITNLRNDFQGIRRLSMMYYGEEPLNIKIEVLASSLDSRQQCQTELSQLDGIIPENSPSSIFCAENHFVQTFEVLGVVDLGSWFKSKSSAETFNKYSECAANRQELLALYRDTVGRNVVAGLCSRTDGVWRLNMLEQ